MIILTYVKTDSPRTVCPGDIYKLTVTDGTGTDVVISEEITTHKVIDFIATYCFTLEDGTVPGFHLAGIFGNQKELPYEIEHAKTIKQLSPKQLDNFTRTCGKRLLNEDGQRVEYDDIFTEKPCHICGEPINKMQAYIFNLDGTFEHGDCRHKPKKACIKCGEPIEHGDNYHVHDENPDKPVTYSHINCKSENLVSDFIKTFAKYFSIKLDDKK